MIDEYFTHRRAYKQVNGALTVVKRMQICEFRFLFIARLQ